MPIVLMLTRQARRESYKEMYDAYVNIFKRCGFRFGVVEADSGQIGGSFSHEFMVLADTGEDTHCFLRYMRLRGKP